MRDLLMPCLAIVALIVGAFAAGFLGLSAPAAIALSLFGGLAVAAILALAIKPAGWTRAAARIPGDSRF